MQCKHATAACHTHNQDFFKCLSPWTTRNTSRTQTLDGKGKLLGEHGITHFLFPSIAKHVTPASKERNPTSNASSHERKQTHFLARHAINTTQMRARNGTFFTLVRHVFLVNEERITRRKHFSMRKRRKYHCQNYIYHLPLLNAKENKSLTV